MKKLLFLLIVILLGSCTGGTHYEGTLHPSSSKLHNIQVIKIEPSASDCNEIYVKYFSFKDSLYHTCYTQKIFVDTFKVGNIRK